VPSFANLTKSTLSLCHSFGLEHHYQPVNWESECCLQIASSVFYLGQPIQLERTIDGRRSREHLAEGDIMITPPIRIANCFGILMEFYCFALNRSCLPLSCTNRSMQTVPKLCLSLRFAIPLIQYIGLALKAELAIDGLRISLCGVDGKGISGSSITAPLNSKARNTDLLWLFA